MKERYMMTMMMVLCEICVSFCLQKPKLNNLEPNLIARRRVDGTSRLKREGGVMILILPVLALEPLFLFSHVEDHHKGLTWFIGTEESDWFYYQCASSWYYYIL